MLEIYSIPDDAQDATEPLGTKYKFWFTAVNEKFLFKEGRPGSGENWAEVLSSLLCDLLQIPHAKYDFAIWRGRGGVISKSFVPLFGRLVHGNELMSKVVDGYDIHRNYRLREHTLRRVLAIMLQEKYEVPYLCPPIHEPSFAIDYFVAYLMLDALISNQDRHHENWSFLLRSGGSMHLAPTYDHASSLGCRLSDEQRKDKMKAGKEEHGVPGFVARARTPFYSHSDQDHQYSTVEALQYAASYCENSYKHWIERLSGIGRADMVALLGMIPDSLMSSAAKEFALSALSVNKDRILGIGANP